MDMVHCGPLISPEGKRIKNIDTTHDLQKGPSVPALVKPERLTTKFTPVPLPFEVAETNPRTEVVRLLGRVAV